MKTILVFVLSLLSITMCESEPETDLYSKILTNTWVLKNHFLGDAIDTPCGYATQNTRDLNLTITKTEENKSILGDYKINGLSAINSYFGSIEITSFNTETKRGNVKIGTIGSTKMGGSQELMDCENRYFGMLNQSEEFQIIENEGKTMLHLGIFKKDNSPSRDGGTYMIFELKKD